MRTDANTATEAAAPELELELELEPDLEAPGGILVDQWTTPPLQTVSDVLDAMVIRLAEIRFVDQCVDPSARETR